MECSVQKLLEGGGLLRAGLNGEVGLEGIGVGGQLAAGLLHNGVAGVGLILGYHANVGGDHVGFQILGQLQDALGLLNEGRVLLGVDKALAQIAAQGGHREAPVLDGFQQLPALLRGEGGGGGLPRGGPHLDALGPHGLGLIQGGVYVGTEGIQHDADGKGIHN